MTAKYFLAPKPAVKVYNQSIVSSGLVGLRCRKSLSRREPMLRQCNNLCVCGCGSLVSGKYKRGHNMKDLYGPDYEVRDMGYKTPCWVWLKSRSNNGYGLRKFGDKRMQLAHRRYYLDAYGVIGDGLQLDHLCRVRHCVNPDHLEPVTCSENHKRGLLGTLRGKK